MDHSIDCVGLAVPSHRGPRGQKMRLWLATAKLLAVLFFFSIVGLSPELGFSQETADFFRQNCASCHTIGGGRLTGPDLKGVTERQERAWLVRFITNPGAVLDSGDPYALKLLEASRNVRMATIAGITRDRAERLLDLIEAESKLEESQFKGLQISTAPFTDADRERGRAIFEGAARLEGGAPACLSCHTKHRTPVLGGGQLGPDLTRVYARLEGRRSLSAWLSAPATATMQPLFKTHPLTAEEIHALVAHFEAIAGENEAAPAAARIGFLLLGLAGAVVMVFTLDALWKYRFYSVRRRLVDSSPIRGH